MALRLGDSKALPKPMRGDSPMQLQVRADEDERKQAGGSVKTKRMLAVAATGCLRQHDAAHTKLRKTSGQSRGEEKARSLASRRRVAVGVRYVGAGVDDVMRDGVGGDAGARCVRTNTNGRQMMCDYKEGTRIRSAPHAGAHRS